MRSNIKPLTSDRIICIKEFVTSIKLIKIYAWENAIKSNIDHLRTKELEWIRKLFVLALQAGGILNATVLMAIIMTFVALA